MVGLGYAVAVREPRDNPVADDLVEPVTADLVRAAVPELQYATWLDATQREIEGAAAPVNDEHIAAHESTDRALGIIGSAKMPVQRCEWFVDELGNRDACLR